MATLMISECVGVVDIDSGKRVGSIHQRECGEYYFRLSPLTEKLNIDEESQLCYILDMLNNGGD